MSLSCSWENGEFIWGSSPSDFRRLTRKELMQLIRLLCAAPHVTHLNLYGHEIDEHMSVFIFLHRVNICYMSNCCNSIWQFLSFKMKSEIEQVTRSNCGARITVITASTHPKRTRHNLSIRTHMAVLSVKKHRVVAK